MEMGFYLRKSLRAGPLRFNLSKSGIGVSAGVPGFRSGTGPRGNYVHAGRGGVYYRASLGGAPHGRGLQPAPRPQPSWIPPAGSDVPMDDVTGASVLELVPSGRGDVVEQLNEAAKGVRWGRWAASATIVLLFVKPPVGLIVAVVASPGVVWLLLRDRARRSVVTFYDVNDDIASWFQSLVDATQEAAAMSRKWRINSSGDVRTTYQYKVNSGANAIVSRSDLAISLAGPKQLKTNIAVPTLRAGKNAIYFLPDRTLVSDGKRFSDIAYCDVTAAAGDGRFIESGGKPRDATQIDTTWQYVNVRGGPDRRYKDNRQLPVMLYGNLELRSESGLNWIVQCSRQTGFSNLARALRTAPRSLELSAEEASHENDSEPHNPPVGKAFHKISVYVSDEEDGGAAETETIEARDDPGTQLPPPVPRGDTERKALAAAQPPAWESLLFASYLLAGKDRLEPKWRDYQLGLTSRRAKKVNVAQATKRLQTALTEVQDQVAKLMSVLSPSALEPAFGGPNQPGDAELIEHLANRFLEAYEALLQWPVKLRELDPPPALKPLVETGSKFVDRPLVTIREFIDQTVTELDSLAERIKNKEPIQLVFDLTLELDEDLVQRFDAQMAHAQSLL